MILAAGDYLQLYRAATVGLTAVLMPRPDEVSGADAGTPASAFIPEQQG